MTATATAPPAIPDVSLLTREQRDLLLRDLVKAHFTDAGMPWYLSVHDGEVLLGVFHPEFHRPENPSIPDFPPEFIEEMKRRHAEIVSGRAELLSGDEFLSLVEKELDRMPPG